MSSQRRCKLRQSPSLAPVACRGEKPFCNRYICFCWCQQVKAAAIHALSRLLPTPLTALGRATLRALSIRFAHGRCSKDYVILLRQAIYDESGTDRDVTKVPNHFLTIVVSWIPIIPNSQLYSPTTCLSNRISNPFSGTIGMSLTWWSNLHPI